MIKREIKIDIDLRENNNIEDRKDEDRKDEDRKEELNHIYPAGIILYKTKSRNEKDPPYIP